MEIPIPLLPEMETPPVTPLIEVTVPVANPVETAELTKAVLAIWEVAVPIGAVGVVGRPVNEGEASVA